MSTMIKYMRILPELVDGDEMLRIHYVLVDGRKPTVLMRRSFPVSQQELSESMKVLAASIATTPLTTEDTVA